MVLDPPHTHQLIFHGIWHFWILDPHTLTILGGINILDPPHTKFLKGV